MTDTYLDTNAGSPDTEHSPLPPHVIEFFSITRSHLTDAMLRGAVVDCVEVYGASPAEVAQVAGITEAEVDRLVAEGRAGAAPLRRANGKVDTQELGRMLAWGTGTPERMRPYALEAIRVLPMSEESKRWSIVDAVDHYSASPADVAEAASITEAEVRRLVAEKQASTATGLD